MEDFVVFPGLNWTPKVRLVMAPFSYASFSNEEEHLGEWDGRERFRSQSTKLIFLTAESMTTTESAKKHLMNCISTTLMRAVNVTIKAEPHQLTGIADAADMLQAALASARDWLDSDDWETSAATWCQSIWLADSRSCSDKLAEPTANTINMRLGTELSGFPCGVVQASRAVQEDAR